MIYAIRARISIISQWVVKAGQTGEKIALVFASKAAGMRKLMRGCCRYCTVRLVNIYICFGKHRHVHTTDAGV